MRDPVEWLLVMTVGWFGAGLFMVGLQGGYSVLTVLGGALGAVAITIHFVLRLSGRG